MAIRIENSPVVRVRRWVAVMILAAVAVVVAPMAFADDDAAAPAAKDTYVVMQGETLWSIATTITPADRSVYDTVDMIKDMNLMDTAAIDAGEQLVIPVFG